MANGDVKIKAVRRLIIGLEEKYTTSCRDFVPVKNIPCRYHNIIEFIPKNVKIFNMILLFGYLCSNSTIKEIKIKAIKKSEIEPA